MGVREAKFFDTTNGLTARTKKRIATKRLVVSTNFISKTPPKIQFWLLGNIFGSKFAKITDRENATFMLNSMYIMAFRTIKTCGVVDLRSSDVVPPLLLNFAFYTLILSKVWQ